LTKLIQKESETKREIFSKLKKNRIKLKRGEALDRLSSLIDEVKYKEMKNAF
jgi:hypothetical protein